MVRDSAKNRSRAASNLLCLAEKDRDAAQALLGDSIRLPKKIPPKKDPKRKTLWGKLVAVFKEHPDLISVCLQEVPTKLGELNGNQPGRGGKPKSDSTRAAGSRKPRESRRGGDRIEGGFQKIKKARPMQGGDEEEDASKRSPRCKKPVKDNAETPVEETRACGCLKCAQSEQPCSGRCSSDHHICEGCFRSGHLEEHKILYRAQRGATEKAEAEPCTFGISGFCAGGTVAVTAKSDSWKAAWLRWIFGGEEQRMCENCANYLAQILDGDPREARQKLSEIGSAVGRPFPTCAFKLEGCEGVAPGVFYVGRYLEVEAFLGEEDRAKGEGHCCDFCRATLLPMVQNYEAGGRRQLRNLLAETRRCDWHFDKGAGVQCPEGAEYGPFRNHANLEQFKWAEGGYFCRRHWGLLLKKYNEAVARAGWDAERAIWPECPNPFASEGFKGCQGHRPPKEGDGEYHPLCSACNNYRRKNAELQAGVIEPVRNLNDLVISLWPASA